MPSTTFLAVVRNNEEKYYGKALVIIFVILAFTWWDGGYTTDDARYVNEGFWMCGVPTSFVIWALAQAMSPKTIVDGDVRLCQNCENEVSITTIMNSNHCEVLGVSESTRAITSSNPVVGVTSTGGHMGVGVGTMQSTSHVPVKLGKVKLTVSCPSCSALFSWIENREVVQWTDPSGQVSYEIPGIVTLP